MWLIWSSAILCTLAYVYWRIRASLGNAKQGYRLVFDLMQDPDAFYANNRHITSFRAPLPLGAGPTTTWLLSPALIKKLYTLPEDICGFDSIKRQMNHTIFGLPKECMTDKDWDRLLTEVEHLFHQELAQTRMSDVLDSFFRFASIQLQDLKWTLGIRAGTIAMHDKFYVMITIALIQTFFGPAFPTRQVVWHLQQFDASMSLAFVPSALNFPFNWWAKRQLGSEAQNAFTSITAYIEEWLKGDSLCEASELVQRAETKMKGNGLVQKDIAKVLGMFMIALVANSSNVVAWLLLMTIQSPALHQKIVTEAQNIPSSSNSSTGLDFSTLTLNEKAPYLMSAIQETLRLFSYVQAIRLVKKDIVMSTKSGESVHLKRGERVATYQRLINTESEVYGEHALAFQGDRFLVHPKLVREYNTFGGGSSICSGRHFAIPEIAGFIILFLRHFTLDASSIQTLGLWSKVMETQEMGIVDCDGTLIKGKWSGRNIEGKCTGSGIIRPACDNIVNIAKLNEDLLVW